MSLSDSDRERQRDEQREDTSDGAGGEQASVECELCGRDFPSMERASDHVERAHSVVTNAIHRNTRRVRAGGGGGDQEGSADV